MTRKECELAIMELAEKANAIYRTFAPESDALLAIVAGSDGYVHIDAAWPTLAEAGNRDDWVYAYKSATTGEVYLEGRIMGL